MLWLILLNVGVYVSTFYLMPVLIEMIRPRQSALNYQNREVPVGLGLVFSLTVVPSLIIGLIVGLLSIRQGGIAIITILSFGLLGLIDDTLGSREARGFRDISALSGMDI